MYQKIRSKELFAKMAFFTYVRTYLPRPQYSFYPFYRQLSCFLQLSVTEVKLEAMEEERDILKSDQENSNAAKDELIKKAWDVRDAAVKRKNNTEIELARTRIDLMQVNSQLLEAIQQKVELSQQLGMYDFWFSSHS